MEFPMKFGSPEQAAQIETRRMRSFEQSASQLQLEGFKVESVLAMMNNCAD